MSFKAIPVRKLVSELLKVTSDSSNRYKIIESKLLLEHLKQSNPSLKSLEPLIIANYKLFQSLKLDINSESLSELSISSNALWNLIKSEKDFKHVENRITADNVFELSNKALENCLINSNDAIKYKIYMDEWLKRIQGNDKAYGDFEKGLAAAIKKGKRLNFDKKVLGLLDSGVIKDPTVYDYIVESSIDENVNNENEKVIMNRKIRAAIEDCSVQSFDYITIGNVKRMIEKYYHPHLFCGSLSDLEYEAILDACSRASSSPVMSVVYSLQVMKVPMTRSLLEKLVKCPLDKEHLNVYKDKMDKMNSLE
jgi:hypothetical protein